MGMYNANQLLELLKNELAHDEASEGRIKSYYAKYSHYMEPGDARMFASTNYLADGLQGLLREVERIKASDSLSNDD